MVDTGGVTSRREAEDRYDQMEASRRDGAGGSGRQQEWLWQWPVVDAVAGAGGSGNDATPTAFRTAMKGSRTARKE